MREFFEVILGRRSVRNHPPVDVTEDELKTVLDAMKHAPSAGDRQAYEVVVVRSKERRRRLALAAFGQGFIARAPVVLVFFMDPMRSRLRFGRLGAELYASQDATIAAGHAQLAAHALGLTSVWVGAFDDNAVSLAVDAPPGLRPTSLLVVRHPGQRVGPPPQRSIGDLVFRESFKEHA